jgi:hypothetical protein
MTLFFFYQVEAFLFIKARQGEVLFKSACVGENQIQANPAGVQNPCRFFSHKGAAHRQYL